MRGSTGSLVQACLSWEELHESFSSQVMPVDGIGVVLPWPQRRRKGRGGGALRAGVCVCGGGVITVTYLLVRLVIAKWSHDALLRWLHYRSDFAGSTKLCCHTFPACPGH